MTREEAKEVFLNRGYVKVNGGEIFDGNRWRQSIVIISEWLKEQQPCEDCINRAELLKAIDTWDKFGFEHTGCFVREPKDDFITYVHYDDVIKCIKGMPSADVRENIHGTWEEWKGSRYLGMPICSNCKIGFSFNAKQYNFCPNCGADMRGET